jgi:hypothetical protein
MVKRRFSSRLASDEITTRGYRVQPLFLLFLFCCKNKSVNIRSGHGSLSDNGTLNSVVGLILHSFILVPYHRWYVRYYLGICIGAYVTGP